MAVERIESWGYGGLPVCMAKTQYSFSHRADLLGAPTGYELPIREVRLNAGAGFVVVICGSMMTMPGLPRYLAPWGWTSMKKVNCSESSAEVLS